MTCIAVLCLIRLHYGATLGINIHEAIFGSLYQDSPGTAIVLAIKLAPTLGVSTLLLTLLWFCRHEIQSKIAQNPATR